MTLVKRKRPKPGDVIEIETAVGLAYFQYTFNHTEPPVWGQLIRVLSGLYPSQPSDFSKIVKDTERFFVFFPLGAACRRELVTIVANEEIPEHARGIPLMRAAGVRDRGGKVLNWRLWDGLREWPIEELTEEARKLSLRVIWNDTMLIERIASGWEPYNEV